MCMLSFSEWPCNAVAHWLAYCSRLQLRSHLALPLAPFHCAESTQGLDSVALMLRGFTYQAIGQLAQRQPKAFAGRIDIAAR